ncbi:hypothetical protein DITRI_Ditri18aG0046200 [Diplodiscus trichospermus]
MVATKLMAGRVAFLLLVFSTLLASQECSRSSVHRDELDLSVPVSNKIVLGPCSHASCLWKFCWCCISGKPPLCYVTKEECEHDCQLGPPRDLGMP